MKKRGQSLVEYVLIIVLVITGVVVMGPYVLRSVGAHFKLWDEGVQDSFQENIVQANINTVPAITSNCSCSYVSSGQCGAGTLGSSCGKTDMILNLVCSSGLPGCSNQPGTECRYDPTDCCKTATPTGICGSIPLPTDSSGAVQTVPTTPIAGNCYMGQEVYEKCGDITTTTCQTDHADCPPPACEGIVNTATAIGCPNSGTNYLNQNNQVSYVASPTLPADCTSNSTPACTYCLPATTATCQFYCNSANHYFLNLAGTGCESQFEVAPDPTIVTTTPAGCVYSAWAAGGGATATKYDCHFSICANAGTKITAVSAVASPSGQITNSPIVVSGDGCQNPNASGVDEGEPGDYCSILLTY